MLINQIALCWLRLNMLEQKHAQKTHGQHSMTEGLYWERRLTGAQRRFTWATETLAKVRRLAAATGAKQLPGQVSPASVSALKAVG